MVSSDEIGMPASDRTIPGSGLSLFSNVRPPNIYVNSESIRKLLRELKVREAVSSRVLTLNNTPGIKSSE